MAYIGITFGYTFWGFMNAFVECFGGLLVALGLFFRPTCVLMAFNMFMATLAHYVSGNGQPGHAAKNMTLFLGLIFIGPGKYSLDALIQKRWPRKAKQGAGPAGLTGLEAVG